ncbi:MAG: hypothetical protein WBE37_11215 [Bryobacteraceae bacterium]
MLSVVVSRGAPSRLPNGLLKRVLDTNRRIEYRDILTPMNYRRGLRRVYLVLAAAWIAGVTLALFSGRWQPWRSELPVWVTQNATLQRPTPDSDSPFKVTPEAFLHEEAMKEIRHRTWIWTAGLSIVPPALLYALVFGIAPWVYRGFSPGAQI